MAIKLALGFVVAVAIAMALQGCGPFGGGGSSKNPASSVASRPGSVPTATPPANLPEPILLGAVSDTGGPSGTPGTAGTPGSGATATYTVKSGDTLSAIAAAQGIPGDQQAAWIAEVIRLNNKSDASLKVGEELNLPRAAAATPSATRTGTATSGTTTPTRTGTPGTPASGTATATPTPRAGTTPSSGGGNTYTVKSGDTPGAIASSLGVPAAQQSQWIAQMLQMNNTTATGLQIGQVLQLPPIPGASSSSSSSGTTPTVTGTPR